MPDIKSIVDAPTTINNVHESMYRSYLILDYIAYLISLEDVPTLAIRTILHDLQDLPHKKVETQIVDGDLIITEITQ